VGVDNSGKLIMVVVPEEHGLTLLELAHLMLELGALDAINLDGGGSSQMWYAGEYLLYTPRPVAQGLIVLSDPLGAVEWTPIPGAQ
jgi:exopolysaccharide biosynthesis protein